MGSALAETESLTPLLAVVEYTEIAWPTQKKITIQFLLLLVIFESPGVIALVNNNNNLFFVA